MEMSKAQRAKELRYKKAALEMFGFYMLKSALYDSMRFTSASITGCMCMPKVKKKRRDLLRMKSLWIAIL